VGAALVGRSMTPDSSAASASVSSDADFPK
jgi:hypothetical protein